MELEPKVTRYRNTATMIVTLEVTTGATWEAACTMEQVRDATIREATGMLRNKLHNSMIRVVGDPKVVVVQHAEEPST
jgi:hypothetical protein